MYFTVLCNVLSNNRVQGQAAAEKARIVEEYMQRKAQAAQNRARAHGDLYGVNTP